MKLSCVFLTISCLVASITIGAAHAQAETITYDFTASSTGSDHRGDASGTLTVVADSIIPNAFDIIGITGSVDGIAITGLLPCDPGQSCTSPTPNEFFYDNLLFPDGRGSSTPVVLDGDGFGFSLADGVDAKFSAASTHTYIYQTNLAQDKGLNVGFSIAPVPEPSSLYLLGTGVLGLASALRRNTAHQAIE